MEVATPAETTNFSRRNDTRQQNRIEGLKGVSLKGAFVWLGIVGVVRKEDELYFSDDKYGEEINCAVILREGTNVKEEDIVKFCKKNLASFKVPKKVFITDSVPKTASRKIQCRIVVEHFLAQISTAKVPKFGA